jgi:transposase InsO family protein
VNIHQNARLSVFSRALLVRRIEAGEKVSEVAASLGVSRRTAYKWRDRHRHEGAQGLLDRSSRPHRSPQRLAAARVEQIERLRRTRASSLQIARALAIPLSTVVATLRRLGLSRLSSLNPPAPPVIRYQRARPGELLHLDTKKLARITHIGHRIHGDPRGRKLGTGWEIVYVAIDDATRLAYLEVLADERAKTALEFLRRATAWYRDQGIETQEVMTDNGKNFIARDFRCEVSRLGARHIRTRPYTPRTNGKAERFIQTCLREWAYLQPYHSSEERTAAMPEFQRYYNQERPHLGICGRSPQQRLAELSCEQRP